MTATRVQTDPRISRRRAAVHRSKRRRIGIGIGVAVALVALLWLMFFSPLLQVRQIKVSGAEQSGEQAVIEATGLLDAEQNLLLLSGGDIEARISELPWVEGVKVQRSLPGTVKVEVTEREAELILSLGAARWSIDGRGHVLTSGVATRGLPTLAGVEVSSVEPGVQLQTEEATDALKVFRALPNQVRSQVSALFAPTVERITLSLKDGTAVRFGAAEEITAKVKVLKALMSRLAAEGKSAAYIDVRVPTSPAVSAGGEGSASPAPGSTASPSPSASAPPTPSP